MVLSHHDTAVAWFQGKTAKSNSMFTDGTTIYSWGEHFPIATKVAGKIYYNGEDYGTSTTRKHQSYVRSACSYNFIEVNTSQIREILSHNSEEPLIIVKEVPQTRYTDIIANLRDFCKSRGVKRFPTKQFTDKVEKLVFISNI